MGTRAASATAAHVTSERFCSWVIHRKRARDFMAAAIVACSRVARIACQHHSPCMLIFCTPHVVELPSCCCALPGRWRQLFCGLLCRSAHGGLDAEVLGNLCWAGEKGCMQALTRFPLEEATASFNSRCPVSLPARATPAPDCCLCQVRFMQFAKLRQQCEQLEVELG